MGASMTGKTVVMTGASSGIGYETTRAFGSSVNSCAE
jgi:NAD(P)-dependent dehydrogenase (short-subunit alcohol dehydrogenase family)